MCDPVYAQILNYWLHITTSKGPTGKMLLTSGEKTETNNDNEDNKKCLIESKIDWDDKAKTTSIQLTTGRVLLKTLHLTWK